MTLDDYLAANTKKDTITNLSQDLVNSSKMEYNFDLLAAKFFKKNCKLCSADMIICERKKIVLVEFKKGFKKCLEVYDSKNGFCEKINAICDEAEKIIRNNKDLNFAQLKNSILEKANDSYIIMEKYLLPAVEHSMRKIEYLAVLDCDSSEATVSLQEELAGSKVSTQSGVLTSISRMRKSLTSKYTNRKDANGKPYFYSFVDVMSSKEYESKKKNDN